MPGAARLLDPTAHPGVISTGSPTVFINKRPAARMTDKHTCALPPTAGPHPPSTIVTGSSTVFINGLAAARQTDKSGCGAVITVGSLNVLIGG